MLREATWRAIAWVVSRRPVADWLIKRAQRTPYTPITSRGGTDLYMGRWWLFNPYPNDGDTAGWERWKASRRSKLPSARIHHICRPDNDAHPHDHPWDARTMVLRKGYGEERLADDRNPPGLLPAYLAEDGTWRDLYWRARGYTGQLLFGQYHRISYVPEGGVWTLFITWPYKGGWGFLVNGVKVPWREYLGVGAAKGERKSLG